MPTQNDSDGFTVFISYAHEDNESPDENKRWLNRLSQHLEPLRFQKKIRLWSDTAIRPGERWQEAIEKELQSARVAVLLVSPAFLASEYIRDSELPVLLKKAQDMGLTVLPIILRRSLFASTTFKYPDPINGPEELSLAIFQSINSPDKPLNAMQEHEQDEVLARAAEQILALAQQHPADSSSDGAASRKERPDKTPSIWHLPQTPNPFFTGRAEVLDRLYSALMAAGKVALSGLGGMGKTQTAVEYAHRHRHEYTVALWAKADSEESLKTDYTAIASQLNLPEKDETDKDVVIAAVKRWLAEHSGWLLVLDNADDINLASDLLRREWGGHLLLTTRSSATGFVGKVELPQMTSEEGTLFLLRRAKLIALDDKLESATEADRASAAELTKELGGLPLALDQAGAFIEETPSSLAEYLQLYRQEGARLRAERGGVIAADHEPVTITFSLAFQKVSEASAAAADLLRACAFLAPEAIPEEIFDHGATELGEHLSPLAGNPLTLVKTISAATRFSLIHRNPRNRTIEMHRVVQQVIKDEISPNTRRLWAERLVRALNRSFPQVEYKNWPLCEKLLPHAQEAAGLIAEYGFEFREASRLLNQAGYYCHQRAQYSEAELMLMRSLSIREKLLSAEHPDVALGLNNLAMLYQIQGKYSEAEQMHMRSLSIFEKMFGPEHPDVATGLNNLAVLYNNQGKYSEAESLYIRSLRIREKVLGPQDPDLAVSFNNLAFLYANQGKDTEAEPLYLRSLSIYENALGPEHPDVATILDNLAGLHKNQGRYSEANQPLVRALSIRTKMLGPEHPDVAFSLNNLATLYNTQGKYSEAEPLYVRALNIFEKVLGPEHPHSSIVRENYTALLQEMRGESEE